MSVKITAVEHGSPAEAAGVHAGESLVSINGNEISDILDYRYYETEKQLRLLLVDERGKQRIVDITKSEYETSGLLFETYLMDKQHSCKNKCVFCFIDQLPKGMRESLYFKDDDERLSFLFGNYITLTNLSERELDRIIKMRISPINVSVHTTNPKLRIAMMKNPRAAEIMDVLRKLASADIKLNCQLVLCPGFNDASELERSLNELIELAPALQSVALVPVGLTKHREGLCGLRLFTREEAAKTVATAEKYAARCIKEYGSRLVWAADELYLAAGLELPEASCYEDYPQLENGVGLISLLEEEFLDAIESTPADDFAHEAIMATGCSAAPLMERLAKAAAKKWRRASWQVVPIRNEFFGETITVAGLVTGGDLIKQLGACDTKGKRVLIPAVMLRREGDLFLDGVSLQQAESALEVKLVPVKNDGYELLEAMLG